MNVRSVPGNPCGPENRAALSRSESVQNADGRACGKWRGREAGTPISYCSTPAACKMENCSQNPPGPQASLPGCRVSVSACVPLCSGASYRLSLTQGVPHDAWPAPRTTRDSIQMPACPLASQPVRQQVRQPASTKTHKANKANKGKRKISKRNAR